MLRQLAAGLLGAVIAVVIAQGAGADPRATVLLSLGAAAAFLLAAHGIDKERAMNTPVAKLRRYRASYAALQQARDDADGEAWSEWLVDLQALDDEVDSYLERKLPEYVIRFRSHKQRGEGNHAWTRMDALDETLREIGQQG
jgi:hypothetical protein